MEFDPDAQFVDATSQLEATSLPDLPNCLSLYAVGLPLLEELPSDLSDATYVNVGDCPALTSIPATLPMCTQFIAYGCTSLVSTIGMANCRYLDVRGCTALTTIASLGLAFRLHAKGCSVLATVPSMSQCVWLEISDCPLVTTLTSIANLCRELYARHCIGLTSLALTQLRIGDFTGCTGLTAFTNLSNAQKLIIRDCTALTGLPTVGELLDLDAAGSGLVSLPALPLVTRLNVTACEDLESIPNLPLATSVVCDGCLALTTVTGLPVATSVSMKDCESLVELPDLPEALVVNLMDCTALAELPDLPEVKRLVVKGCTSLETIPELPEVTHLDLTDCTGLTALPDPENVPNIVELKITGTGLEETWIEERLEELLTATDMTLEEVLETGCWNCHSSNNCPMYVVFGTSRVQDIPEEWRFDAAIFVPLFDAGLIPEPEVEV